MALFAVVFLLVIVLILAGQLWETTRQLHESQEHSSRWKRHYDELATEFDRRHRIHCDALRHARRIEAATMCILKPKQQ